eukprot:6193121-Pleurochrysis_carterae.AAC.1
MLSLLYSAGAHEQGQLRGDGGRRGRWESTAVGSRGMDDEGHLARVKEVRVVESIRGGVGGSRSEGRSWRKLSGRKG